MLTLTPPSSTARRATPRRINRHVILNLVREHEPIARVDLARRMGLGPALVAGIVGELIAEGLLIERGTGQTARGRRPRFLFINSENRFAVAVAVNTSRTTLMLSDLGGRGLTIEAFATQRSPSIWARQVGVRARRLVAAHGGAARCRGLGIAVPGILDSDARRLLNSFTLGWRDVDLARMVEKESGLRVTLENAARAAALAHLWWSRGETPPGSFFSLSISDGVGGTLVADGRVARGHDNLAGSVGHIPVVADGPRCHCGAQGCLETLVSDVATLARYFGTSPFGPKRRMAPARGDFTLADLIARARGGDNRALEALTETGRYIGLGLRAVVNLVNPDAFVIDGEIAAAWDLVGPTARAHLAEHALTARAGATPIHLSSVPDARLKGAAVLVIAPTFAPPTLS